MSLFDIAPSRATVTIGGTTVPVPGISLTDLVALLGRFPALKMLLGGGEGEADPSDIIINLPVAACAIIAAGCGHYGDAKAEAHIAKLSFGDQLKMFEAVVHASLPDGVGPTVARLNNITTLVSGNGDVKGRAKKSPQPSKN